MSRKSHNGIAAVAKSTNKALREFNSYLKELGFRRRTEKEILAELIELRVEMPERATAENATQDQWIYQSDYDYEILLYTGMIKNEFTDRGSSWVLIRDEDKKSVFVREFYRRDPVSLLGKLSAYANLTLNIVMMKKPGFDLVEVSETEMAWEKDDDKSEDFDIAFYFPLLDEWNISIIKEVERKRKRYFLSTAGKVRRERTFRKKWKK